MHGESACRRAHSRLIRSRLIRSGSKQGVQRLIRSHCFHSVQRLIRFRASLSSG